MYMSSAYASQNNYFTTHIYKTAIQSRFMAFMFDIYMIMFQLLPQKNKTNTIMHAGNTQKPGKLLTNDKHNAQ